MPFLEPGPIRVKDSKQKEVKLVAESIVYDEALKCVIITARPAEEEAGSG